MSLQLHASWLHSIQPEHSCCSFINSFTVFIDFKVFSKMCQKSTQKKQKVDILTVMHLIITTLAALYINDIIFMYKNFLLLFIIEKHKNIEKCTSAFLNFLCGSFHPQSAEGNIYSDISNHRSNRRQGFKVDFNKEVLPRASTCGVVVCTYACAYLCELVC